MDVTYLVAVAVGALFGTIITRAWLAYDLDAKLPWLRKRFEDDEDGPHAQR